MSTRARRLLVAGVVVLVLLSVTVFALRARALVRHGDLFWTSGLEGVQIYNIWKVQHGHPLYEVATRPPYVITLYNFLFYRAYAEPLAAVGIVDARTLVGGRLMTTGYALVGVVFTTLLIRHLVAVPGAAATTLAMLLSIVLWFGSGATGWSVMTLRPDIAAAALATIGLWLYVRGQSSGRLAVTLLAGLAFCAAWGFKQSAVLTWAGVIAHAAIERRWRMALAVAGPVLVFAAAAVAVQNPSYRFSIFVAPGVDEYSAALGISRFVQFALVNPLFLVLPLVPLVVGPWKVAIAEYRRVGAMLAAAVVGVLVGAVTMARVGGGPNYLFEGYFALGALGTVVLLRWLYVSNRASTPTLSLVALALAVTAVLPVAQLAFRDWFAQYRGGAYRVAWGEPAYDGRRTIANALQGLPKPLFTRDDVFAQPWHASGNGYPSFVIDGGFYRGAERRGLLSGGGIEALIEQRVVQSLLLHERDGLVEVAERAGFVHQPWPGPAPAGNLIVLSQRGAERR